MYVYIHIYKYMCIYIRTHRTRIHVLWGGGSISPAVLNIYPKSQHSYIYIYIYVCNCIYIYIYTFIYIDAYMHTHMYVYICRTRSHILLGGGSDGPLVPDDPTTQCPEMYIFKYIRMYIYTCMFVCIYT